MCYSCLPPRIEAQELHQVDLNDECRVDNWNCPILPPNPCFLVYRLIWKLAKVCYLYSNAQSDAILIPCKLNTIRNILYFQYSK